MSVFGNHAATGPGSTPTRRASPSNAAASQATSRAALVRLGWHHHEHDARSALAAGDVRCLVDAGILAPSGADLDDRRTITRRAQQLAALDQLIAYTEAQARLADTRESVTKSA